MVDRLRERLATRHDPLFVGIDGRSGVGKSTLAAAVSERFAKRRGFTDDVALIDGDDFYAGGSGATWDRRTAAENANRVIDWRRQRDILQRLRHDGVAAWSPFDWEAENWDGESVPLLGIQTRVRAAPVILLEGAYSCRPELHELLDLRVLMEAPDALRRRRLLDREAEAYAADWHSRWEEAEDHYFHAVMPPERYHLVLIVEE